MKLRTRRRLLFVLIAGLLGLVPIAGSLVLAYRAEFARVVDGVEAAATHGAERAADTLMEVEAALADLAFEARSGCSEALVEAFGQRVAAARVITNIGLVDARGALGCTGLGVIHPPLELGALDLVRPPGELLAFSRPAEGLLVPGVSVAAVHQLRNDDLLVVAFAPRELLAGVRGWAAAGAVVRVAGEEVARDGPLASPAPSWISRTVAGGVLGLEVEVSAPRSLVATRWRRSAASSAGIGALAGALLVGVAWWAAGRRPSLNDELVEALENQEFEVHYQPVIELASGACTGAEALIRWRHPERGMVSPDLFIALAEETGHIVPITRWLIERIAGEMGDRLRADPAFHIAVNLAPVHFETLEVVEDVKAIAARNDLVPGQLLFEATERGLMDDPVCQDVIDALGALGSAVALDDFGTGYSSLAYLDRFRLDYLKIDKAFVSNIGTDAPTAGLAAVIIEMAGTMGLRLIAEGVETEEQAAYLRERGVDYAQGWLFSRPLPGPEFLAYADARAISNPRSAADRLSPSTGDR